MLFISSLHKDQKSSSLLSVVCQRLCLLVEFVLGCDFVCLVHFFNYLSSLPDLLMHYIFSDKSPFFFSSLCSVTRRQFLLVLPLFNFIKYLYLCNLLISTSDISW